MNVEPGSSPSILPSSVTGKFTAVPHSEAQPIADAIRYPNHPEYIIMFSLILGFDAMASIPFALLRQQGRPTKFAIIKNINILSNIILNVYFLMLCPYIPRESNISLPFYDATIGVGYVFISNLASIITIPLLSKEILGIRKGFVATLWWKMIAYGLPLLIVGLGGMVNETLERAIMKYLLPAGNGTMSQVGIYGANYKLSILMSLFIQAFRFAAEPFFFSHAKTSDKKTIYARVMDYFVIVCLGIFLLVTLYRDMFKYFIGEQFYEGLKVVPILLLANLCLGVYYNLSIWYKLSDQTRKGAMISLIVSRSERREEARLFNRPSAVRPLVLVPSGAANDERARCAVASGRVGS